jgi:hypothetical protein
LKRDCGTNGEETREGSSTPGPETSAVQSLWQHKTEEKEGGGEGTRVTTDNGAGKSDCGITEDVRGQASQEGVPRNGTEISAVAEDSEAENTDTEVREATYLFGRVRGAEWNSKRVMGSSKDQSTHSKGNASERERPTEGKRRAGRVGTSRDAARKRRNPACNRKGRERDRRIYKADEGRATRSATPSGRTERGGRCEYQAWWIGWRQRFDENRWV